MHAETRSPDAVPVRPRRGGFFWGLATGVILVTAAVILNDTTFRLLPVPGPALAETSDPATSPVEGAIVLEGAIPPAFDVLLDGRPADMEETGTHRRVARPRDARTLSIRGPQGVVWSTRLGPAGVADTLRPVLGGEIVFQVHSQGPAGQAFVNGEPAGNAPGSVDHIPAGWNLVSIREGDRILFEDECEVRPGEVSIVQVPPAPPWGKGELVIRSFLMTDTGSEGSSGDVVRIDGEAAGRTPLSATLPAGLHSVSVERSGFPNSVDVIALPAGQTRIVRAEFGREGILGMRVAAPPGLAGGKPGAVAVEVTAEGETVILVEGALHVLRPGRDESVDIPLVPAASSGNLWLAGLPRDILRPGDTLQLYARGTDDLGRTGVSEIVSVRIP